MRVAALYDIHGNLPALDAVLARVRTEGADLVLVGGDVLPGPMPCESMDRLLSLDLPVTFIRGNGDREVLANIRGGESLSVPPSFREGIRWNAGQLPAGHESVLAGWADTVTLDIPGLDRVLFCHATPRDDNEIFTRDTPESVLRPIFEAAGASLVVCGHTHMQFDRTIGRARVVNAGSVGMPFGDPGAYWLMLGPEVELRRTKYDLEAAADRIRATSYPQAAEFAENHVLHPPAALAMLQAFSKAELR